MEKFFYHNEIALPFYSSVAWKKCRKAYAKARGGVCEICLANGIISPGEIVHHKIELNEDNINNPDVTLNWDNLQLVCRFCHAQIHKGEIVHSRKRRFIVAEDGHVIASDPPPRGEKK